MKTFFVTLNWNSTDLFKRMIQSVTATTDIRTQYQWIILDNGSDGGSWKSLSNDKESWKKLWPGVMFSVIRSETNLGCILAHNLCFDMAAHLAQGKPHQIVMVDTDVEVFESGWLTRVLDWADAHPQAGIIGMEHSRGEVCAPAIFLDTSGNWYLHREDQVMVDRPEEGESVGLGLALIRWPVLAAGLRFDPLYQLYYKQDDDLCFQVRSQLGLQVWAYPIDMIHYGSGALRVNSYNVTESVAGWDAFDAVKQENQRKFAGKWRWLLRNRRETIADERKHLDEMRRVIAEHGGVT